MALEECGQPYETVAIDLQNKSKEFCELYERANPIPNARAKVPVLETLKEDEYGQSVVITESLVVTDYIAERYTDAGLKPTSSEDIATMRLFSELCGTSTFSYWNILRAKGDNEKFESAVQEFKQGLINTNAFLEKRGDPKGPFLFGKQFTLAECNAAPFLQRACNVLPAFTGKGGTGTSESDSVLVDPIKLCEEEGLIRLNSWISAVLTRPSVKHVELSEEEMFQSVSKMLKRFEEMENK